MLVYTLVSGKFTYVADNFEFVYFLYSKIVFLVHNVYVKSELENVVLRCLSSYANQSDQK